jgi:hypothetical protein
MRKERAADASITGRRPMALARGIVMKLANPTNSDGSEPNRLIYVDVGFPGIVGNALAMSALLWPCGPGGVAGTGPIPLIWLRSFGSRPEYSKINIGIMPAMAAWTARPIEPTDK